MTKQSRDFPIGAEVISDGVHFRVWAPKARELEVVIENTDNPTLSQAFALSTEEYGYFSGLVKNISEGTLYRFRFNQEDFLYPDPASRFQPFGPHGPSQVIDPSQFQWTDHHWKGVPLENRVLYEMHIGTYTSSGTWNSAMQELQELADLGISIIQMMPVNEFCGKFGWGYDGVNLFAPTHLYGYPNDLREFIDRAHALGIAVILDVVYNHFGPDGNYLRAFTDHYFTHNHVTDWGEAINFDSSDSKEVRAFYVTNARYWIDEFHFDGLRFDATQNVYDSSTPSILSEICQTIRQTTPHRNLYLVAENELQQSELVNSIEDNGTGLDALLNDDFHHVAHVRLTGHNEAYYTDYMGTAQEFISAIKYGYLYQGQWYLWHLKNRGTPGLHLNPSAFITFIQNHDQIANSAKGLRIHLLTDPGNYRAMTGLLLLAPGTPLLFQGQEFAANSPFYYFADHTPELAELIFQGRRDSFKRAPSIYTPEILAQMVHPSQSETFLACKLNFQERQDHKQSYQLHKDLLQLRRRDPVFSIPRLGGVDGAVLGPDAFVIRFFGDYEDARLLFVNFGVDLHFSPAPEPLLAPPKGTNWEILWSSENPRYGGSGTPPLFQDHTFHLLGHAAVVCIPRKI